MKAAVSNDSAHLDRECVVFCRYLVGQEPSEYVKKKYRAAHQASSFRPGNECRADAFLVKMACIAPPGTTKIIDAYTRIFRPYSVVRKKLILLLAILESCAPTHGYLDSVDTSSIPLLFLRLVNRCLIFALAVACGVLILFPAELMLRGHPRRLFLWLPRNE
jgi:hypothetical protein